MWWGTARGARAHRAGCPAATCRSTSSSTTATSIARTSTGRPGEGYPDNLERFTFLSRGALELCKALGFIPDVIHCNDWQTALVPVYLEHRRVGAAAARGGASVYSIHNLAYQGVFDGGAHVHHRPRARALQPAASSNTSAR